MAKQEFPIVSSQDVAWDAQLQDWQDILSGKPFPLVLYSTFTDINTNAPAASNEDGLALVGTNDDADYTQEIVVVEVDGAYKKLAWQTATLATLTGTAGGTANDALVSIPDPADTPASADALRDDLVANVLPVIRNDIDDVRAKLVALLAALKASGAMDS